MLTLLLRNEDLLRALIPILPVVTGEGGPEESGEGDTRHLGYEV